MNEYIAFRQEHGIDDKSYKDLYLGDYFRIQDGTYNAEWIVAHFDYYYNKGEPVGPKGVVLIPGDTSCGSSKMNNTDTSVGGYASSIANTTVCPAIATALQRVLGSYLLTISARLTYTINTSIPSMAGANWQGASTNWNWVTTQCILPNEIQLCGSNVCSSSFYDTAEACDKLAVFNFINCVYIHRATFWLRNVASSTNFSRATITGITDAYGASNSYAIRPLIYIG